MYDEVEEDECFSEDDSLYSLDDTDDLDEWEYEIEAEIAEVFDAGQASPGEYKDHSAHPPGNIFSGREQTLGAGPDEPPPTASSEPERDIGRGNGFAGSGAAPTEQTILDDFLREMKYSIGM